MMQAYLTTVLERLTSLNSTAQAAVSLVFLLAGILLMEWFFVYVRGWIRGARARQDRPDIWRLNFIRVPLRLLVVALLLRLARLPLTLPETFSRAAGFLEDILPALALLVLAGWGFSVIRRLIRTLPENLGQAFPEEDYRRVRGLTLLALVAGLGGWMARVRQVFLVPGGEAIVWWQGGLALLLLLILFFLTRLVGRFHTRIALGSRPFGDTERLRLLLRALLWPLRLLLVAAVLYAAGRILPWADPAAELLRIPIIVLGIGALFLCAYLLLDLLEYRLQRFVKKDDNLFDDNFVQVVRLLSRFAVILIGAVVMIQTISGKPLSALLAGLGIGGLAVALAAQDTLKNLFGGFMIMLDKPFSLGERVLVDGQDGVVEQIGFRSTRLRTLTGHLVTVPNEKMAANNVENIGRRPYIRRLSNLTITYDTPPDKIERALEIVRGILDNHEGMDPEFPPRVYFSEFNDASLNLLMVYWYHPNDYWAFCRFNETVNLQIMRAFEAEGIEFAFPTQTLYLAHDPQRRLQIDLPGENNSSS